MINSADEVGSVVDALVLSDAPIPVGDMRCQDVEQLFTNIEHSDLKKTMHLCIDTVWKYMAEIEGYHNRLNWENLVLVVFDAYSEFGPEWEHKNKKKIDDSPESVLGCDTERMDRCVHRSQFPVFRKICAAPDAGYSNGHGCSWLFGQPVLVDIRVPIHETIHFLRQGVGSKTFRAVLSARHEIRR